MKKKLVAYTVAAMLIGLTVMMLPLATEPAIEPESLQPNSSNAFQDGKSMNETRDTLTGSGGLASQPFNLLPSSLILLAGLAVAFSVYIIFKRQLG